MNSKIHSLDELLHIEGAQKLPYLGFIKIELDVPGRTIDISCFYLLK